VVHVEKKWFKINLIQLLSMAIQVSKSGAKRFIDQGAVEIGIQVEKEEVKKK